MSLCSCFCSRTDHENPTGADALGKAICEGAEWDGLPRHEFRRGIELPKHPLEGRSYDRGSRVAADDFIQGNNDRIVGDIHGDSALNCRSSVNGKTLNSGTARNSASESTGTISESNKAIV
jgi:hypothetical protein